MQLPGSARWGWLVRRWWPDGAALLFFGLVSFVLLWPLSSHLAVSTNNEGDALEQIWVMGWGSHALTTDPANLFNGNIFYPYQNTLAYADDLLAQTLQGLPIYLLTGNLVLTYGVLTLFSFVLSGWGVYLLIKASGGGRGGGLFAGMVFAFAAYKVGHLSQLNLLSTQWIPFCFLFLRRLMEQNRPGGWQRPFRQGWGTALAFAGFFVLNALSTFYYFFYILPLLGLYLIGFWLSRRQWPTWAFWLKLIVAGVLASVLILPTLLPYAVVVGEQSAERTSRDVEEFSANYRFYLGANPNNLLWGKSLSRYAGTGGERALFPGALAYLMAFLALVGPLGVGLWRRVRPKPATSTQFRSSGKSERWIWVGLGLFSLIMSFGWTLHLRGWDVPGLYRLFYLYFPGWVAMRAAVRYGVFVLLAIAVLGGLTVGWLSRLDWPAYWQKAVGPGRGWLSRQKLAGGGLLALLLLGTFWEYRSDVTYTNPGVLPNPPAVYRWLAEPAEAGPVLELPAPPDPVNPPSIRSYYTTFNWQPFVNGVAAYIPPVEQDIARLSADFPSTQSLAAFQGIGVRWLVFFLQDENAPLSPDHWQKIEARLAKTPEVRLAKDFPADHVKVYELAANPWMRQAYADLAAGSDVIVSDYRQLQPTLVELFQTMLRRDGHTVYGADRAGYRYLTSPPTGHPVAAGLFAADEDPTPYGFSAQDESWSGYGLKFYRRKEKLAAAYDISRDPKLAGYTLLTGPLDLKIEKDGLKFQDNGPGGGLSLDGDGRLNLLLSSFEPQTLRLNGTTLALPGGMSLWRSPRLTVGQTVRLEPAQGKTLYLNRAELTAFDPALADGLSPIPGATLLRADTVQRDNVLTTSLTAWTPPVTAGQPGSYVITLDIYRRPWGTHPGGHFATYSVALSGQNQAHTVGFDFNPTTRQTQARVDGGDAGVGSEVFKAAGNGDWTVFITLRRSNPTDPKDFPLVGLSRLYDFNLTSNQLSGVNLLPDRQIVLLPSLPGK